MQLLKYLLLTCLLLPAGRTAAQLDEVDPYDSSYKMVNLRYFKPGPKVVQIEYGKVTVYARQQDYFGRPQEKDTVVIAAPVPLAPSGVVIPFRTGYPSPACNAFI